MTNQDRIINALAKKLGSASNSLNVLLFQFRRKYPTGINIINMINSLESRFNTNNEPTDDEVQSILFDIMKI